MREAGAPAAVISAIREQFHEDLQNDVWRLLPVTDRLLHRVDSLVRSLPAECLIRAGDAIHLATAIDTGFDALYTNDRRLMSAAEAAGLRARTID